MQISAANLLLAGQQPRAADGGRVAGDGFARALSQGGAAAKPAQFAPPSFEPASFEPASFEAEAKTATTGALPAPKPAAGYGAFARPGTQLDIRV